MSAESTAEVIYIETVLNDDLHLFTDKVVNEQMLINFLGLTVEDISKFTGVPKADIIVDSKTSIITSEKLHAIAIMCQKISDFYQGDGESVVDWFQFANPLLGNISPTDMIRFGRLDKLSLFIDRLIEGDIP